MQLSLRITTLLLGVVFLMVFISLARKQNVKPFYSALWLIISGFMISLVVLEPIYKWIATLLGITDASFMIIVSFIAFLLFYVLYLSVKISAMSDRIQELISFVGILENKLRKIDELKAEATREINK